MYHSKRIEEVPIFISQLRFVETDFEVNVKRSESPQFSATTTTNDKDVMKIGEREGGGGRR